MDKIPFGILLGMAVLAITSGAVLSFSEGHPMAGSSIIALGVFGIGLAVYQNGWFNRA